MKPLGVSWLLFFSLWFLPAVASTPCRYALADGKMLSLGEYLAATAPAPYRVEASAMASLEEIAHKYASVQEIEVSFRKARGDGTGNLRLHTGTIHPKNLGHPEAVFIKVPGINRLDARSDEHPELRTHAETATEIYWTKYLAEAGWGAKFYGLQRSPDARLGIVTEYLRGSFTGDGYKTPRSLSFEQRLAARKRIFAMKKWCQEQKLYVEDLQLRFNDEGLLYIVDPEFFRYLDPPKAKAEQKYMEEAFDRFLAQLPLTD